MLPMMRRDLPRLLPSFLPGLLPAVLAACSPARLVDAITPHAGYTLTRDIAYGAHPRQRLDLYETGQGGPLMVFFHGGAWRHGDKADHRFVAQTMASAGIDCAVPNYRLFPEGRFQEFMADAASAVLHLRRPVVLAGHSAGAHIALLLALDAARLPPGLVLGAIGLAGPYDFLPLMAARHLEVLDGPHGLAATQPISFAHGPGPPLLLVSGDADTIVRPANTRSLAAARRAAGGSVRELHVPAMGHLRVLGALAPPLRSLRPGIRDEVVAFARSAG